MTISQVLKSRTMQFAIALTLVSALQGLVLQLTLTPLQSWAIGTILAIAVAILRILTTTPLAEVQ